MIPRMALPRSWHSQLVVTALSSLLVLGGCGTSPLDSDGRNLAESLTEAPKMTFIITLEATDRCLTSDEGLSQFAMPLEDELWTIAGVHSTGTGASAGLAHASVTFALGTPPMAVLEQVEQAVARVAERLPKGTQARLYMSPFTTDPHRGMLPVQCLREGAG